MVRLIAEDQNLASLLKSGIVFVDWWAPWCGPCRAFGPVFDKVAAQNPEVAFARINADEHRELAMLFGIRAVPTLMIFREGILVYMQAGPLPEEALQTLASRVKDLDMDVIRAKLAAQTKTLN